MMQPSILSACFIHTRLRRSLRTNHSHASVPGSPLPGLDADILCAILSQLLALSAC